MVSRITRCHVCLGLGRLLFAKICPMCNGQGTVDTGQQANPPPAPYVLWLNNK